MAEAALVPVTRWRGRQGGGGGAALTVGYHWGPCPAVAPGPGVGKPWGMGPHSHLQAGSQQQAAHMSFPPVLGHCPLSLDWPHSPCSAGPLLLNGSHSSPNKPTTFLFKVQPLQDLGTRCWMRAGTEGPEF